MTGDTQIYTLLKDRIGSVAALALVFTFCIADMSFADDAVGPPIHFYADLSADEQSAVTDSPALGRADFILDRATLRFSWVVTYSDLTSAPTAAGLHGPQTPGGMQACWSILPSPVWAVLSKVPQSLAMAKSTTC